MEKQPRQRIVFILDHQPTFSERLGQAIQRLDPHIVVVTASTRARGFELFWHYKPVLDLIIFDIALDQGRTSTIPLVKIMRYATRAHHLPLLAATCAHNTELLAAGCTHAVTDFSGLPEQIIALLGR
ncbi:hypothetical protein KBA73_04255 [Patescibacteria group bacterium]|nr:hypothetical protein [Patescibacteria group bacterium]